MEHPIIDRWNTIRQALGAFKPPFGQQRHQAILIAVSKGQLKESIMPLLEAGQYDFGENRVQEALIKWPLLKAAYPRVRLHFIGALQTNKVKEALALFDVFHTIDRKNLVDTLSKYKALWSGKQFFVQVNTGDEDQKAGIPPVELDGLLNYCSHFGLPVSGLMCIPPAHEAPAPHFALLHTLAQKYHLPFLSMGMSGDYETALRLGATHIRIGTALFGPRQ